MNNITMEEVKEKQLKLEKDVLNLVTTFEKETNLNIENIMFSEDISGLGKNFKTEVIINATLA